MANPFANNATRVEPCTSESVHRGNLEAIMERNKLLADEILVLNNSTKLLINSSTKHPSRLHFEYLNTDLEKYARGFTGLLMERLMPGYKTLNIEQLELYFTPESVNEFKNRLLQFTVPTILGG